jgi:uncharacterized membrane protein
MPIASERRTLLADVPADTWLRRHWREDGPNVTGPERWLSIAGGAGMALVLGRRGGVIGALGGVAGAGLVLRGLTGRCAVKHAMVDKTPAKAVAKEQGWSSAALIHRAVSIGKPRDEVYATWRDFSNLAKFMENIERIEVLDDKRSHWVVQAPFGKTVEWDAVVTEDRPGELIAWETAEGAQIKSAGWVEFKDGPTGRGTEVRARFAYKPPAGKVGQVFAKLLQREPNVQARRDLKRFKQFMETGEVSVSSVPGVPPRASDRVTPN